MKVPIVSFGYNYWKMASSEDAVKFLTFLLESPQVSREYVDGKYIYIPKEEVKSSEITLEFVAEELVRDLTPKEVENKEIASLKNTLSYKESELTRATNRIKELECLVQQKDKEE